MTTEDDLVKKSFAAIKHGGFIRNDDGEHSSSSFLFSLIIRRATPRIPIQPTDRSMGKVFLIALGLLAVRLDTVAPTFKFPTALAFRQQKRSTIDFMTALCSCMCVSSRRPLSVPIQVELNNCARRMTISGSLSLCRQRRIVSPIVGDKEFPEKPMGS